MAIKLPVQCLRSPILACKPLSQIESDDGTTFVCCGRNDRDDSDDPLRLCFKAETTDTMYDHDELDLLDTIHVASLGLAVYARLQCVDDEYVGVPAVVDRSDGLYHLAVDEG